jgi:hypothetical protein
MSLTIHLNSRGSRGEGCGSGHRELRGTRVDGSRIFRSLRRAPDRDAADALRELHAEFADLLSKKLEQQFAGLELTAKQSEAMIEKGQTDEQQQ